MTVRDLEREKSASPLTGQMSFDRKRQDRPGMKSFVDYRVEKISGQEEKEWTCN
jgi:hypothetical protein